MLSTWDELDRWLAQAKNLRLFLDYDGTLAEFTPVSTSLEPVSEIVDLLVRLAAIPSLQVVMISGRRLEDLQKLLPVPGIFLTGVYGLEVRTPAGEIIHRLEYSRVRPQLEEFKPRWEEIVTSLPGFYIEDKGWSLALHMPLNGGEKSEPVATAARRIAAGELPLHQFRLIGRDNYLEVVPVEANKGGTVDYILQNFPLPGARLLYLGDDAQDEQAFERIIVRGGIAILVSGSSLPSRLSRADFTLPSPQAARQWLRRLVH